MENSKKNKEIVLHEYQLRKKLQGCITLCAVSNDECNSFDIGDLVMTTAGNIKHPAAMKYNLISSSYLLIGTVVEYRMQDWVSGHICRVEDLFVNWQNLELMNNRFQDYRDGNPVYYDGGRCFNILVEYDFIHSSKLTLVARRKNNTFIGINRFIEEEALKKFHHTKDGWHKNLPKQKYSDVI